MKILLIEDEPKLGRFLCEGLANAGHVCDHYSDGENGLKALTEGDYALVVLDLLLPKVNGIDILTKIREFPAAPPILVLSALSEPDTVIRALDLGAIDYIKKPFDFQEMLARIRSIERRRMVPASYMIGVGDLRLNMLNRQALRGNELIQLSGREFSLLEYLLKHSNQVVSKSQILRKVWNIEFDPGSNIVEVHMYQLRKKIEKADEGPLIQTIIGKGYMLKGEVLKG